MQLPRPTRRQILLGTGALLAPIGAHAMSQPELLRDPKRPTVAPFDGRKFRNVEDTRVFTGEAGHPPFLDFLTKRASRSPSGPLPLAPMTGLGPAADLRAFWIGHSTVLLEIDGVRVLTDPVWSEHASPVPAGPRRFLPTPVSLDALPLPDVVLLSHDHYDHLDAATVRALGRRGARFVAPLGVAGRLLGYGVPEDRVTEVDWGESVQVGVLRVVAEPARHFSGRGPFDRNSTLWCSYALQGPLHRAYFGGDGGHGRHLAEIGARHAPFDLALLEIGAWDASWADIHLGPENAARAMVEVGARTLLPIHWATFDLGLHPWKQPADTLHRLAQERGLRVAFPKVGEALDPLGPVPTEAWWRDVP